MAGDYNMGILKITAAHQEHMKAAILKMATPDRIARYEKGEFVNSDKVNDFQKRFNFDLMSDAIPCKWICDNIYAYANDDHLESFLKTICPTVTRKF